MQNCAPRKEVLFAISVSLLPAATNTFDAGKGQAHFKSLKDCIDDAVESASSLMGGYSMLLTVSVKVVEEEAQV